MNFKVLPSKDIKGIWIMVLIIMLIVVITFLNNYTGPDRKALSFLGFDLISKPQPSISDQPS